MVGLGGGGCLAFDVWGGLVGVLGNCLRNLSGELWVCLGLCLWALVPVGSCWFLVVSSGLSRIV